MQYFVIPIVLYVRLCELATRLERVLEEERGYENAIPLLKTQFLEAGEKTDGKKWRIDLDKIHRDHWTMLVWALGIVLSAMPPSERKPNMSPFRQFFPTMRLNVQIAAIRRKRFWQEQK